MGWGLASAFGLSGCQSGGEEAMMSGIEDEKASWRQDYAATGVTLLTESTPSKDGFIMPGEELEHRETLMVFPPEQNWIDRGIQKIREE